MYNDIHFRAMNTDVNAWLWHDDAKTAQRALQDVERFFHEAHSRFTRFETTSELSALNDSAGKPFTASPQMFEVVELTVKYAALTGGWFNPTIIGALEAAGYDRTFEAIKDARTQRPTLASAISAVSAIQLDAKQRTITLPQGVRIDLGGIAKGWTVQKATERLAIYGPCLVDAGGDMLTFGAVPGSSSWSIEIADPLDPENDVMTLYLRDQAVATSGIDRRRWQRNGMWQHHLIDPYTSRPSDSDLLTATVIAPTTVEAEVYAKTVFLLGSQAGLDFIDQHPTLAGSVITADGAALNSKSMKEQNVRFSFSSTINA
ncbi:MAG TPA: FAD:protein FMN transferase [Anaerolineae bacterium]|nr:FAD:protein FMN transferase [Anaerolineae bacterium]